MNPCYVILEKQVDYLKTFCVGYYDPKDKFVVMKYCINSKDAREEVHYLNGGNRHL